MYKRAFLVLSIVLFLAGGVKSQDHPLEVINYSFEYDCDGNLIIWKCRLHKGDCLMGWKHYPEESMVAAVHTSVNNQGATDGVVNFWINGGATAYQVTPNIFEPGRHYELLFDTKNWETYCDVLLFYPEDGNYPDANHVDFHSESLYFDTGYGSPPPWGYDYGITFTSVPGSDYIGKALGIKFYNPNTGSNYWFMDNVRLNWRWAVSAYNPTPFDGEREIAKETVTLKWNPGVWGDGHEVYFGTSWEDVNSADRFDTTGIYKDDVVTGPDVNGRYSFVPDDEIPFELGGTYYWRVDEVNEDYAPGPGEPEYPPDGRWKGDVWQFRVTGYATNPSPADGETSVPIDTVLSWTAGTESLEHDVYFGTSFEDVDSATQLDFEYKDRKSLTSYDSISGREYLKPYYWRIDEVNETGGTLIKGDVWTFTVADSYVIDNFDSYTNTSKLGNVWDDGADNWSGSQATLETETVRDGNSMRFGYYNSDPFGGYIYYSEIEADVADLEVFSNWKFGGAESLVLWFYGDWDNAAGEYEQMYAVLEDGDGDFAEVHYYGDMNDIRTEEWQEWNIGLDEFTDANSALDLTHISKIYIGFGIRGNDWTLGGDGVVWFEDIRLYPARCVPKLAYKTGSFDGDCFTDYYDLALLGKEWLLQAKGVFEAEVPGDLPAIWYQFEDGTGTVVSNSGYMGASENGTFGDDYADPAWGIGYDGTGGLVFDNGSIDEVGDYVSIPAPHFNTNTLTITAWVKRNGDQNIYAPIVFSRQSDDPNIINNTTAGLSFGSTGDPDWLVNNELIYTWEGMESTWDWHTDFIVHDSIWTFIAVTICPTEANLYMYIDGELTIEAATNYIAHGVEEFDGNMYLGWNTLADTRFYNGVMDDVRIYERTLTPAEIMGLAGLTGEHYIPLEPWRNNPDDNESIDLMDYTIMAENWLEEVWFPVP